MSPVDLPEPNHPLTAIRRQGVVQDIANAPTTINVFIGGDVNTLVACSYLSAYQPAVGDTVSVLANQGDYVVLGSLAGLATHPLASTWQGLNYAANVTDLGSPWDAGQWIKVGTVVYLRGLLKLTGNIAANGTLFTMPAGARLTPNSSNAGVWPITTLGGGNLYMDSSGNVKAQLGGSNTQSCAIGFISYVADA